MKKTTIALIILFGVIGGSIQAQNIFNKLPYDLVINKSTSSDLSKRGNYDTVDGEVAYDMLGNFHAFVSDDRILTKIIFEGNNNHRLPKAWKSAGLQIADTRYFNFSLFGADLSSSCVLGTSFEDAKKIIQDQSIKHETYKSESQDISGDYLIAINGCQSLKSDTIKSDHEVRYTFIKFTTNSNDFYLGFVEIWGRNKDGEFVKNETEIGLRSIMIEETY